MLTQEKHRAQSAITNLRDVYEAGIWNTIGQFGHNQAFLDAGSWQDT